jgi:hypothetical protein
MNALKLGSIIIITGSVFFIIAAFSPISRIFGMPSPEQKLEIILSAPNQWIVAQIFFALGALVTAAGISMVAYYFRNQPLSTMLNIGVAILVIGAFLWTWHVYLRAIDPQLFVQRGIPVWYFATYTFFTQIGLVLFGIALLRTELQNWVGWMMIGGMGLFFVLTIIFRDMPPFVYYIVTLIAGFMMYRSGGMHGTGH